MNCLKFRTRLLWDSSAVRPQIKISWKFLCISSVGSTARERKTNSSYHWKDQWLVFVLLKKSVRNWNFKYSCSQYFTTYIHSTIWFNGKYKQQQKKLPFRLTSIVELPWRWEVRSLGGQPLANLTLIDWMTCLFYFAILSCRGKMCTKTSCYERCPYIPKLKFQFQTKKENLVSKRQTCKKARKKLKKKDTKHFHNS